MAFKGSLADAHSLADIRKAEASNCRSDFGCNIPLKHLAGRLCINMLVHIHAWTCYSALRPLGCSLVLGSYRADDCAQLCITDPSGGSYGYLGCASGKSRQAAKTEIGKL